MGRRKAAAASALTRKPGDRPEVKSVCIAEGGQMECRYGKFSMSVSPRAMQLSYAIRSRNRLVLPHTFTEKHLMSSTSDLAHNLDVAVQPAVNVWSERLLPALFAVGLGAVLIFGAGFSSKIELHNAAHDGRHSAGFPCH
jgi:cobalt transporter subunit CbtB